MIDPYAIGQKVANKWTIRAVGFLFVIAGFAIADMQRAFTPVVLAEASCFVLGGLMLTERGRKFLSEK